MICANPECKKRFLPKRSDSNHCSLYCIKRNKFLKRKDYYTAYLKKYRKDKYEERKEFNSLRNKKHYLDNKGYYKDKSNKRRAIKLRAIPKFANLNKIREIYKNCPKGYHVDHIIPLNNPIVCGLHVEWNLQYLSAKDNCSKGNKLIGV
jgi:hypothetical protein